MTDAAALTAKGIKNKIIRYEGAPHSFFDRSYEEHKAACDDAWRGELKVRGARADLELETPVASDTAPLHRLVHDMLATGAAIHCLRDPTRGGVATALNELAHRAAVGIVLDEAAFVVREPVRGVCELLGLDPLYVANEGKLLAIVPATDAGRVLDAMRRHPQGREACVVGEVVEDNARLVVLKTTVGGRRIVDMLQGEQLPRIC